MEDYVTTKPRLNEVFSNLGQLRDVFTWVFLSSLLLWKFVRDKISKRGLVVKFTSLILTRILLQLNQAKQTPKFYKMKKQYEDYNKPILLSRPMLEETSLNVLSSNNHCHLINRISR